MNIQKLIEQYERLRDPEMIVSDLKTLQTEMREWIEKNKRYSEEETTNPYLYEYEIKHAFGLEEDE